jgi:hypothetical protein
MNKTRTILLAAAAAFAGLFVLAGCQLGDASIQLSWTINGLQADSGTCGDVDGVWVRIIEDENHDGVYDAGEWYSARRACRDGRFETLKHFFSGRTHTIAFELLDLHNDVVARVPGTDFRTFIPEVGVNDIAIDFITGPVCGNGACETGEDSGNCPADCTG